MRWLRHWWRLFAGTPIAAPRSLTGRLVRGDDGTWRFEAWPQ